MRFPTSAKNLLIFAGLMVLGAGAIRYWFETVRPYETTDNAYIKAHLSLLSSKETGYVKEVLFQDNQRVKKGDVLTVIDDHEFKARVAEVSAEIAAATARIAALESEKRTQAARVREEEADIASASADHERSVRDLNRLDRLADAGAASAQALDNAKASFKQAKALLAKNRSAKEQVEIRLIALDAVIAETRATVQQAQARLELAQIDLENTRIAAPIDGIIGNRSVQVGQLLQPGSVLAYLIPADGLFVEANFKETQIEHMRIGQAASITVDAYPAALFEALVDSLAPASGSEFSILPAENATGNFTKIVRRIPVKLAFAAGTDLGLLKPGLSVQAKIRVH